MKKSRQKSIFVRKDLISEKKVNFQKDPEKTDFGYEAVFDDADGNYKQLLQIE